VSVGDLFTRDTWAEIGKGLRGVGERWWEDNEALLVGLAEDEARDLLNALRSGDPAAAKLEIASRWIADDRASWRAYRDGTTAQLEGLARRRADLMDALEDLGRRSARLIGMAAIAVIGL
jgi:hypothetical protein